MTIPQPECHGLDTIHQVCFYEQDFYVLSNFSSFSLLWKGIRFPTLEHAYHWEKFSPRGNLVTRYQLAKIRREIKNATSAHDAFRLAQKYKEWRRPDWDHPSAKVRIMFMLLVEKVKQHDYVRTKLINTGTRRLAENSWRDNYWGWGENEDGLNVLGQLWMLVRTIVNQGFIYTIDPQKYSITAIQTTFPVKGA